MSQQTIFDDRSPAMSFFSLSASWNQETNPLEFNQTSTWTNTAQDSVSISFNGTSISVFGTLDGVDFPAVHTSYQLDDPRIPTIQLVNSSLIDGTQFQQMFYQSPVLDPGPHTLIVTNLVNGSTFRFDFVKVISSKNSTFESDVRPPPISTSSSTTSSTDTSTSAPESTVSPQTLDISPSTLADQTSSISSSTSPPTIATGVLPGTPSTDGGNPPTGASTSAGSGNGTHLAAILGGILGAVGLIVWVVVFLVIQRRRRQRNNRTRRMSEFLRRNSEKRSLSFTPLRRQNSDDLRSSSFGTPDPNDAENVSRFSADAPVSTYELTPFTDHAPTSVPEILPVERSVWSPEPLQPPLARGAGKKRGYYYRDSPPKYNSGQFYHLDS